jgi:hypothetical protein
MTEPTLAEIFRVAAEQRERELFTAFIGAVEKYTPGPPGPPVVDVRPVIKRAIRNTAGELVHEELPVVPNVPVCFPSVGNFSLTFPIAKGDHVLCVCTSWSHQAWRETGGIAEPGDLRTHEPGNAIAIPGLHPKSGTLPANPTAALLEVGGAVTHVQVGAGATDHVALAELVWAELGKIATGIGGAGGTYTPPTAAVDIAALKLKAE